MLARIWSNWNSGPGALLVNVSSGSVTLETSFSVSYKVKHILSIQLSNFTPRYLPNSRKHMYTKIFIHGYALQPYST